MRYPDQTPKSCRGASPATLRDATRPGTWPAYSLTRCARPPVAVRLQGHFPGLVASAVVPRSPPGAGRHSTLGGYWCPSPHGKAVRLPSWMVWPTTPSTRCSSRPGAPAARLDMSGTSTRWLYHWPPRTPGLAGPGLAGLWRDNSQPRRAPSQPGPLVARVATGSVVEPAPRSPGVRPHSRTLPSTHHRVPLPRSRLVARTACVLAVRTGNREAALTPRRSARPCVRAADGRDAYDDWRLSRATTVPPPTCLR